MPLHFLSDSSFLSIKGLKKIITIKVPVKDCTGDSTMKNGGLRRKEVTNRGQGGGGGEEQEQERARCPGSFESLERK